MRITNQRIADNLANARRQLTRIEFAAMEIVDQNEERDLEASLSAISAKAELVAAAFNP